MHACLLHGQKCTGVDSNCPWSSTLHYRRRDEQELVQNAARTFHGWCNGKMGWECYVHWVVSTVDWLAFSLARWLSFVACWLTVPFLLTCLLFWLTYVIFLACFHSFLLACGFLSCLLCFLCSFSFLPPCFLLACCFFLPTSTLYCECGFSALFHIKTILLNRPSYRRTGYKCEGLKIMNCEVFPRSQFLKRNIKHK